MPVAAASAIHPPSLSMDDRKRPAAEDLSSTPPLKKQVTRAATVNGTSSHPDHDMPWKDDIERYQKDALLRQMREYKRERNTLSSQLEELNNRSAYHDEHLRIIDSWFLQLIDELALLTAAPPPSASDTLPFSSTLLKSENDRFEAHLSERSSQIKAAITRLFSNAPVATPGVLELQQRIASLLSAEKAHAIELQRLTQEKDAMSDRYESAVSRYMIAEKKLDRVKSAQVAKLEAAAMTTSRPAASTSTAVKTDGDVEEPVAGADMEKARKEATALAEKRQQQLEILVKQNVKLENELAATKAKWEGLTDDDYAKSELFQTIKSQLDDTVKRVNDLEAQNIQLREEARVLQGERISYKEAADTEVREQTMEMQNQLAQGDMDLVRVRHSRDEIKAELSIRAATIEQHSTSQAHLQELLDAKDLRIQALESEAVRLRQSATAAEVDGAQIDDTDVSAVLGRLRIVENEKAALESEVRSMEAAYKKAQTLASRKLTEISDWEEKLQRLSGEKAKADQKYFASMKSIEAKNAELKALKAQAARSTDMVSTLKEAESTSRLQLDTLNKQLAEAKESFGTVSNQHRAIQHTITEQKALINRLEAHSNEFKKQVAAKVELIQAAERGQRAAEGELAELKVRLESTEKSLASWKKKGSSSTSEEYETLRTIAQCNVCHNNWKNTVLKTCGHVTCEECIEKQITLRSRKCPLCGKPFGKEDYMRVTL